MMKLSLRIAFAPNFREYSGNHINLVPRSVLTSRFDEYEVGLSDENRGIKSNCRKASKLVTTNKSQNIDTFGRLWWTAQCPLRMGGPRSVRYGQRSVREREGKKIDTVFHFQEATKKREIFSFRALSLIIFNKY